MGGISDNITQKLPVCRQWKAEWMGPWAGSCCPCAMLEFSQTSGFKDIGLLNLSLAVPHGCLALHGCIMHLHYTAGSHGWVARLCCKNGARLHCTAALRACTTWLHHVPGLHGCVARVVHGCITWLPCMAALHCTAALHACITRLHHVPGLHGCIARLCC